MSTPFSVWIDVEDIFQYFDSNARPSGIQRLVYEILRVIRERAEIREVSATIRLVRRGDEGDLFAPVSFDALEHIFEKRAAPDRPQDKGMSTQGVSVSKPSRKPALRRPGSPVSQLRHFLIRTLEELPGEVGTPLLTIAVNQLRAVRLARRYARLRLRRPQEEAVPEIRSEEVPASDPVPSSHDTPRPGDVFLILGAAWSERGFGERLSRMRRMYGIRPVLLVYDLIPAVRPEWCAHSLIHDFRHFLDTTLPQCGRLLAISHATARSVEDYARMNALKLEAPIQPVPIGSGFGPKRVLGDVRPPGLPQPRSYVLFVSTMEARKNHILAFQIWQRLLTEQPIDTVPTLVFAGREGWLVADLMQQLDNTEWLRGKIRLLRDPTDDELAHLYDGCLFTLFPSLFEGWGLPVTESLINGAPCVASNATSIPEAGGSLSRYFDPENLDDACRVVWDVLADREGIDRWRQEVRDTFAPVPWSATADAVLEACEAAHREETAGEGTAGEGTV